MLFWSILIPRSLPPHSQAPPISSTDGGMVSLRELNCLGREWEGGRYGRGREGGREGGRGRGRGRERGMELKEGREEVREGGENGKGGRRKWKGEGGGRGVLGNS